MVYQPHHEKILVPTLYYQRLGVLLSTGLRVSITIYLRIIMWDQQLLANIAVNIGAKRVLEIFMEIFKVDIIKAYSIIMFSQDMKRG